MNESAEKIQHSELEVMRVLWEAGEPVPLSQIRQVLAQRRGWEDSTVKTLLRRLCSKNAVKLVRRGVYTAAVTKAEYSRWSVKDYISRVFAGSAKELVASLIHDGDLSQEDITELSEMFNEGSTR